MEKKIQELNLEDLEKVTGGALDKRVDKPVNPVKPILGDLEGLPITPIDKPVVPSKPEDI